MDVASLLVRLGISADTKPLEGVERRLDSLNSKLRLIAGAEVVKALYHLTEGFGHSALELLNTSSAAGLTTEAMQRLQFAVTQSGGNAAELGMTMTHLARMINGAKMGADDALQTFYLLGISQQQIASFKSTEDALYGVMGALQKIQDPIRRQAMMDRALGQGSRGLGRFALSGEAAARASEATAKRIGALVPRGTLERVAQAKASIDALGMMFRSVGYTIAGLFAPVVGKVVQQIEDFYVANKKTINLSFHDWVVSAAGAFGVFTAVVEVVGGAILRFIGKNGDLIASTLKVALAVGALKKAFEGVKTAWSTASAIFTAAPYILAGIGLAIMASAVHDLYTYLTTGSVEDFWLVKLYDRVGNFFTQGAIGELAQKMIGSVYGATANQALDWRALLPNVDGPTGNAPDALPGGANYNAMENLRRLSGGLNLPAMPSLMPGNVTGGNAHVTQTNNTTINVPKNMTSAEAVKAVTAGVSDQRAREMAQAWRLMQTPLNY